MNTENQMTKGKERVVYRRGKDSCGAIIVLKSDSSTRENCFTSCKVAIVRGKKRAPKVFKGYSFPKGHVENDETNLDTAIREIEEETGLRKDQIEFVKKLGEIVVSDVRSIHLFLFTIKEDCVNDKNVQNLIPPDADILEARWVTIQDALDGKEKLKEKMDKFLRSHLSDIEDLFE